MQVTRATFIPLLAPGSADRIDPGAVLDDFCADLTVAYTFGPQFGRRVVTHADLDQLQLPLPMLRRTAFEHLEVLSSRAEFHGQPPALMLSFEGLESSLLLATDFWSRLEGAVPGELVVGVPARDVVIVTGSQSGAGMEKVRRCVERVFFAGGDHPLSRHLLVRRSGTWEPFDRPARTAGGRPGFGPAHQLGQGQPPRQYQEHQSWPSQQVRPVSAPVTDQRRGPGRPPVGQPMRPAAAAGPVPGRPPMSAPQPGRPVPSHSTGFQPVVRSGPPARDQRPSVHDIAQYSATPYSAMPHSVAPQSATPYSAMPHSVAPQSATPYSAMPYSAVPGSPAAGHASSPRLRSVPAPAPAYDDPSYGRPVPKPRYADDEYSTGTQPRYSDTGSQPRYTDDAYSTGTQPRYSDDRYSTGSQPRYADDAYSTGSQPRYADQPAPEYPASWGWAPEQSASRPEWRSSPRARFSSR